MKRNEDMLMNSNKERYEMLLSEKETLEKEVGMWIRKQKDYEWRFNNLLDEISKLTEMNTNLETRLKGT